MTNILLPRKFGELIFEVNDERESLVSLIIERDNMRQFQKIIIRDKKRGKLKIQKLKEFLKTI